jgi:hypothetical protein
VISATSNAEVLLSKTPHLFGRLSGTFTDCVPGLFAAEDVSATAHVRIDRLVDPSQFGADLVDVAMLHYSISMIAAVDVHYQRTRAVAAGIVFRDWLDDSVVAEQVVSSLRFRIRINTIRLPSAVS